LSHRPRDGVLYTKKQTQNIQKLKKLRRRSKKRPFLTSFRGSDFFEHRRSIIVKKVQGARVRLKKIGKKRPRKTFKD
jgi:hypothetical protein